jgi:hypothetical protein
MYHPAQAYLWHRGRVAEETWPASARAFAGGGASLGSPVGYRTRNLNVLYSDSLVSRSCMSFGTLALRTVCIRRNQCFSSDIRGPKRLETLRTDTTETCRTSLKYT